MRSGDHSPLKKYHTTGTEYVLKGTTFILKVKGASSVCKQVWYELQEMAICWQPKQTQQAV